MLFSNSKPGRIDHGEFKDKRFRRQPTTGNSNMATQTGSTYTAKTITDNIELPTAIWGLKPWRDQKSVDKAMLLHIRH